MKYILIAILIYVVVALGLMCVGYARLEDMLTGLLLIVVGYSVVLAVDYSIRTSDTEIWSGQITNVYHKEEWDEWIPPRTETYTTTSNGRTVTRTRIIPGRWVHHYAKNSITTTDNGTISVDITPTGERLTDDYVNSTEELALHFPIGSPTASFHQYTNKIKASNSVFKRKEIDIEDYPDLPEYPSSINKYQSVNRLIGINDVLKSRYLDKINANLNNTNNPNNKEQIKGYKQVNLILVDFKDKDSNYGYALQNYWQNGAKNDVVVCFGTNNNKPTWSYVFSWSQAETMKTNIEELIMSTDNINKEYNNTLDDISKLIEEKYERREFEEFDYIQIEVSFFAKIILILLLLGAIVLLLKDCGIGW